MLLLSALLPLLLSSRSSSISHKVQVGLLNAADPSARSSSRRPRAARRRIGSARLAGALAPLACSPSPSASSTRTRARRRAVPAGRGRRRHRRPLVTARPTFETPSGRRGRPGGVSDPHFSAALARRSARSRPQPSCDVPRARGRGVRRRAARPLHRCRSGRPLGGVPPSRRRTGRAAGAAVRDHSGALFRHARQPAPAQLDRLDVGPARHRGGVRRLGRVGACVTTLTGRIVDRRRRIVLLRVRSRRRRGRLWCCRCSSSRCWSASGL